MDSMSDERLEDLLARLERERREADDLYHAALTALDRSLPRGLEMPHPPPAYDEQQITPINLAWDILPGGPPASDGSFKGRLRGFIWRLVGPSLEKQKSFNAAVVDHVNRNVAAHVESQKAIATLIALMRQHVDGVTQFQSYLIQYLQTITLYIDTKDRSTAAQAQVINAGLSALGDDWLKRWESLTVREQRFNARVQALDDLRSIVSVVQQMTATLKREVEQISSHLLSERVGPHPHSLGAPALEDSLSSREPRALPKLQADLDSYKYVGFEDRFRGSRDDVRARLAPYLPVFDGASDVVDIGCGRGELLDLLRQHGVGARGVDLNAEMVAECRARGLAADVADAVSYLAAQPDGSLGGVIAIQVVEHLEPGYLMKLLETAGQKLRPSAPMVLETINPSCWLAFFESYIRDVSHVRPLHPDTLQYFVQASGFSRTEVRFSAPVPDDQKLEGVRLAESIVRHNSLDSIVDAFNANVARLNARLFTNMDYAVVAWK